MEIPDAFFLSGLLQFDEQGRLFGWLYVDLYHVRLFEFELLEFDDPILGFRASLCFFLFAGPRTICSGFRANAHAFREGQASAGMSVEASSAAIETIEKYIHQLDFDIARAY